MMLGTPPIALTTPPKLLLFNHLFIDRNSILMSDGLVASIGGNVFGIGSFGTVLIPVSMVSVPVLMTPFASSVAVPILWRW